VALAEGLSVVAAAQFASAAAAISVTRSGAQTSIPDRKELDEFVKSNDAVQVRDLFDALPMREVSS
jgi:ribokinase